MPQVSAEAWVPIEPAAAFALSQTTGDLRLRWDPFIRSQHLMNDARRPSVGVRTLTHSRLGPSMVSEYVSYRPPTSVGMTMISGPWFFRTFGGGWRFEPRDGGCRVVWKYTYSIRPPWLSPVAEPLGQWLLGQEIRRRLDAFRRACADAHLVTAAQLSTRDT